LNLKKFLLPYFYASVIAALDLYIKYLIRTYNIQEKVIIENFLTIDLTYNTGIAFGLFSEYTLVTYFFSVIVFSWLIFQFRNVKQNTIEFYSLILILGGAIGNLGERGWNLIFNNNGKVTDFVELLFIPSFNLADTYITFGICFLLISEIKNK
jgi:signal peptidase II